MSDVDDEFNPRAHNTLLQAISGLKKTQHIRQTTRNEPRIKQDEFELVKGTSVVTTQHISDDATPAVTAVAVNDLVQVLRKKKKHIDAGKLLKNVQRTKKVFQKPLEKPAAERIKRTIGYDKVKTKLERWDAVVAKNRVAEQQIFPLATETVYINTAEHAHVPLQHTLKSELRREMEAAEERLRQLKRERDGDFENEFELEQRRNELHQLKLTREELLARRKELAYLKMRESQQSAKARMRNKIKSKKYHKLLRRQKLQAQLKEFEQLQKTNPEAALEKLEELEKSRVLERATLRHKNTGAWAKNLQVRAKYDKDVRKDLSEQLKISRELTQKSKAINDDDDKDEKSDNENNDNVDEDDDEANMDESYDDPNNPWLTVRSSKAKTNGKVDEANKSGGQNWRKYWMDRNRDEKLLAAYRAELEAAMKDEEMKEKANEEAEANGKVEVKVEEEKVAITTNKAPPKQIKQTKKAKFSKIKQQRKSAKLENGWLVEELEEGSNVDVNATADSDTDSEAQVFPEIDDLFDEVEASIESNVKEKLKKLRNEAKQLSEKSKKAKKRKTKSKDALKNLKDLSFKQPAKRPKIDEELGVEETDKKRNTTKANGVSVKVEEIDEEAAGTATTQTQTQKKSTTNNDDFIDPTNFPNVTFKQPKLKKITAAAFGDNDDHDDNDDDNQDESGLATSNQMTIGEAFEDDDIIADFGQEKSKDSELKNTEIDLSMPGWGSWAGAGIDPALQNNKRPKRLVLKLAPEERRRDENKGELYINEESAKQVRPHLVSDLPFPFTSLQDYEASIRAPIGRNFVPETAFRMLTRPAVITRKGTIIEPMDESELTKKPKRPTSTVDYRIKQAEKEKQTNKVVAAVK